MSSLMFDAAPSAGWSINFLASAATGALFAPGTFQQSGWWMALAVACSAFVFSVGSFAAYVSLTIFVSRIQEASVSKKLLWRMRSHREAAEAAGEMWKPVASLAALPFRCRSVVSLASEVRFESGGKATTLSAHRTGKKAPLSTVPGAGSEPLGATLDSVVMVDFVGGSLLLTKLYEATQLVQFSSAFLLKMASAVDLVVMFASKNLTTASSGDSLGTPTIPAILRPMLSTQEGVATVVFSAVMLLCILPPLKVHKMVLRVADLTMLALHVLLGLFLLKHLLRQFGWSGEFTSDALYSLATGGARVPLGTYQDRVPEGLHLSQTYTAHERFYFACVAILTSFIPHVSTASILREVPVWRAVPRLCASMVRWMFAQLLYFVVLGVVMDSVLPAGRTTSRMAVFNFVDYRTWLPNSEEDTPLVVCFALVPLVHVLSTARGLCETIATLLIRTVSGDSRETTSTAGATTSLGSATPFSLLPAGTRAAVCSVILLVITHVSATYRPLFWLITSNCVLHIVYLLLYLRVFKLLNARRRKTLDAAISGQLLLGGKQGPSSWWEYLCGAGTTQGGVLPTWFLCASIAFWVSCLLYWVS